MYIVKKKSILFNQTIFLECLKKNFPLVFIYRIQGEVYLKTSYGEIYNLIFFLKNHTECLYSQLIDLSFIDYPERKYRFEIFYNLLSLFYNHRIIVTASIMETFTLKSIVSIFPNSN